MELSQLQNVPWFMGKGMTPEELSFNFTLAELKEVAKELNIKGRSRMDKITLCLNIEDSLKEEIV